jgi:hypothetical protein
MTDSNFPALYEAADIASLETQNLYLKINVINNFLLIFGAAIAILRNTSQLAAGFAAFLFLVIYRKNGIKQELLRNQLKQLHGN